MGLRAFVLSALPEEPWRNGGGRTRTIATGMREPPTLAVDSDSDSEPAWDWRISVATIERSGPFSAFPGVDRSSLLLGAGSIELSAMGEATLRMQCPGDVVAYRGDAIWNATVHGDGSPQSLLNVMTRRRAAQARTRALRDDASLKGRVLAVLVIDGRWRVVDESDQDRCWTLGPGEGAFSDAPPGRLAIGRWRAERVSAAGMLSSIEINGIERLRQAD